MSFQVRMQATDDAATIWLSGELDSESAPRLNEVIAEAVGRQANRLVLLMADLTYMSSAGLRSLVLAHQKLPYGVEIVLIGTQPDVAETIRLTGMDRSFVMQGTPEP
jgi:anti-anti-sigma factor